MFCKRSLGKINAGNVCGRAAEIERSPALFHLIIKTSCPGLLIGRKGEGADKISAQIIGIMKKIKAEIPKEIKLTVEEIQHPESSAKILPDGGGKSEKECPSEGR